MATGTQGLTTLRAALGATEGASTTPTRILYPGVPTNVDLSGLQQFATIEDRVAWGKYEPVRDVYAGIEDNTVVFTGVPATYEDIGLYLATIPGVVSGSGTGAGTPTTTDTSAYTRTFTPSQTITAWGATGGYDLHLQAGFADLISTVSWSVPGLRCSDFNLSMQKRGDGTDSGVLWGGTWQTPKTATQITALTGSLSDRTQTLAIGTGFSAFVDTSQAGLGGTADTNVIRGNFQFTRPVEWHDGGDGTALHTSMHFPAQWTSMLTIVRKFSDLTELTAWKARSQRAVRLKVEGAVVGAATAKNTIQLDFIGKPTGHRILFEGNGILYAEVQLIGQYDATQTASWKITTISTTSAAYTTA
jgi:hypothetical protein